MKQFDKAALRKCRELIEEKDSMVRHAASKPGWGGGRPSPLGSQVWRTALERVEIEMAIMKQLEHPNIVAFHEAIDDGASIFMRERILAPSRHRQLGSP